MQTNAHMVNGALSPPVGLEPQGQLLGWSGESGDCFVIITF